MEKKYFIIFGEDFQRHPHALEHILRPLFGQHEFLWVETMGLRSPKLNLYDVKRALEKVVRIFKKKKQSTRELPPLFTIISPPMIPLNQFAVIRAFNRWSVLRQVRRHLPDQIKPITLTSVPNSCDYVGEFAEELKVYFCVDEFSLWPGLNYEMVRAMEAKLLARVDMVIATSDQLAKTKVIKGKQTPVITHGVEFERFDIGVKDASSPYHLCYFGLFDERTDQQILLDLIEAISDLEIHIFGPVVCNTQKLSSRERVHFYGRVPYEELPAKIAQMDAFILPYVRSELTDNINPLKLKEYLATSRPVLATALPEVAKLSEYLHLFHHSKEAIDLIHSLRKGELPHDPKKVRDYVISHETWKAKSWLLMDLLHRALNR